MFLKTLLEEYGADAQLNEKDAKKLQKLVNDWSKGKAFGDFDWYMSEWETQPEIQQDVFNWLQQEVGKRISADQFEVLTRLVRQDWLKKQEGYNEKLQKIVQTFHKSVQQLAKTSKKEVDEVFEEVINMIVK